MGCLTSASSSVDVPQVLTLAYSAISYMLWPTPTRAARWMTQSTPRSARRHVRASRTSPTTSSTSAASSGVACSPAPCTCGQRLSSTRTS